MKPLHKTKNKRKKPHDALFFKAEKNAFCTDAASGSKKAAAQQKSKDEAPAPAVVKEAPVEEKPDDTQLIAVITAAIAAYTAESGKTALPFRVVSYKRVRGANGWNGADENETI